MKKLFQIVLFASAAALGLSATASADGVTIGGAGSSCETCQGSTYALEIEKALGFDLFTGDGVADTYLVTLTIDTTNYDGGGKYIDEVAIKISSSFNEVSIYKAPDGASNWSLITGGIDSDGCSGTGSGFQCSDWVGSGRSYTLPGAQLVWQFYVDVSSPLLSFDSLDPPSIKARYVDADGEKVGGLVSEKVPEPTTLALLGVGMSLAAIRRRRAQRR